MRMTFNTIGAIVRQFQAQKYYLDPKGNVGIYRIFGFLWFQPTKTGYQRKGYTNSLPVGTEEVVARM
jgi:hypothetical protein